MSLSGADDLNVLPTMIQPNTQGFGSTPERYKYGCRPEPLLGRRVRRKRLGLELGMSLFFFDTSINGDLRLDDEGVELSGVSAARQEALEALYAIALEKGQALLS